MRLTCFSTVQSSKFQVLPRYPLERQSLPAIRDRSESDQSSIISYEIEAILVPCPFRPRSFTTYSSVFFDEDVEIF